jgi:uncharacterized GH25 family protein
MAEGKMRTLHRAPSIWFLVSLAFLLVRPTLGDEPKPAERTMQVTVLGPDDRPLSGAKIHVSLWTKEPFKSNRDFVCDTEGRTKFDLPKQIEILRLWASKEDHVALFAQWWPEQEPVERPIPEQFTFRLAKGTTLSGAVKNDKGEPVAGAKVEVRLRDSGGISFEPVPSTWLSTGDDAVKTDAEGKWSITNAPREPTDVQLLLTHPDYVSDEKWGDLQGEQGVTTKSLRDGSATIVMHDGIAVTGTVADPAGTPVADAMIVWGEDPYFTWGSQETRTDKEGKYRIPPMRNGLLTLTVVAENYAPQQQKVTLPDQAAANFQLAAGESLRIHFIDEIGAPVPEVSVLIQRWRGNAGLFNIKHPNVLDSKIPRQANKGYLTGRGRRAMRSRCRFTKKAIARCDKK